MNEVNEKDTGRIEVLSDGVFGVALTLLAIELNAPVLHLVNNRNLLQALLNNWPQYLTILNSFASILLMWISHHSMFKLIHRASTPFMVVNGLLLLFITLSIFSTKTLSFYLLTNAATVATAFYALVCLLLSSTFNWLWYLAIRNKEMLKQNIPERTIAVQTHTYRAGVIIYIIAFATAFINPWITVSIITLSWMFWIASFKRLAA